MCEHASDGQKTREEHSRLDLKKWGRTLAAAYLLVLGVYLACVWGGLFILPPGDAATRTLQSFPRIHLSIAENLPSFQELLSPLSPWPPTPFVVQGLYAKTLHACGLTSTSAMVAAMEALSLAFVFLGILCWVLAVKKQFGVLSAYFTGLFLLACPALQNENFSMMTRYPVFALSGFSAWMMARYWDKKRLPFLLLSALALLAGTLFRNEVIVPAFATCVFLFLFSPTRFRDAFLFGAVSGVYHLARMAVVRVWHGDAEITFMNYGKLFAASGDAALARANILVMLKSVLFFESFQMIPLLAMLLWMTWRWHSARKHAVKTTKVDWSPWIPLAYWGLLACVFTAFLFVGLCFGRVGPQFRYALLPTCYWGTIMSILAGRQVEFFLRSREARGKRLATACAALMLLCSATLVAWNIHRETGNYAPIREALPEFSEHSRKSAGGTVFDTVRHLELGLQLYTYPLSEPLTSFSGWGIKPALAPAHAAQKGHPKTLAAHRFVHQYRPRLAVLASDAEYAAIQDAFWAEMNTLPRPESFFRDYLQPVADSDTLRFRSPYYPEAVEVEFHPLFETSAFQVYQLTYSGESSPKESG